MRRLLTRCERNCHRCRASIGNHNAIDICHLCSLLGWYSIHAEGDVLINLILPAGVLMAFWVYFGATLGKMALSAKVVDADTGEPLAPVMSVIRYFGYFMYLISLGMGFF